MAVPIKLNIPEKSNWALRPSVPANQKQNADEYNLLTAAVTANYDRLILNWDTDIPVNTVLTVGQYVLKDNTVYRIITQYNVGSPITWNASNAESILESSPEHFKGVYADETALTAAHPTADPGDYALVDVGASEAELWIWDDTDIEWVASGVTTIVPPWDDTTPGIVERSTTAEAQNIVTRTAAGSSDTSNSDARAPSEKGLVEMLLSFLAAAWTWAAKQTFTTAPRFSSTTASQFLKVDSNKDLQSVASATQAEMITGTDDTKPATALGVESKRSIKSVTVSNSATGATNIDCGLKQEVKVIFNTAITGGASITLSNDTNLEFLHITIPITGSNIALTFPSSTRMARYFEVSSGDGWYQGTKILQVSSVGTADLHEFSLVRIAGTPTYKINYDGPARA